MTPHSDAQKARLPKISIIYSRAKVKMSAATSTRYIRNDESPTRVGRPRKEVLRAMQDLITRFPPDSDSCEGGFYSGTVSIALLLMKMTTDDSYEKEVFKSPIKIPLPSTEKHKPDDEPKQERSERQEEYPELPLSIWLIAYLKTIGEEFGQLRRPREDNCGISCSHLASLALEAAIAKDADTAKELSKKIGSALDSDESSNEWLNGRAGALYLLRLTRASFTKGPTEDPETGKLIEETQEQRSARKTLNRAIEKIILGIMDSPRPWRWRGKHYLGAVHGDAGIITQVILSEPGILLDPEFFAPPEGESGPTIDYRTKIELDIGILLSYQDDDGNWPSSTPGGRTDLVEFCHGAPGIVSSLQSIRDFFDHNPDLQSRIDVAIDRGQALM